MRIGVQKKVYLSVVTSWTAIQISHLANTTYPKSSSYERFSRINRTKRVWAKKNEIDHLSMIRFFFRRAVRDVEKILIASRFFAIFFVTLPLLQTSFQFPFNFLTLVINVSM